LREGQWIAVSGKRQRLGAREGVTGLTITFSDGLGVPLAPGDTVRLTQPPAKRAGQTSQALSPDEFAALLAAATATPLRLAVLDRDGRSGTLDAQSNELLLARALKDDETVQEIARIAEADGAVVH